jgi:hypothetical protein
MQIDLTLDEVELLVRALDVLTAEAGSRGYVPVREQADDLAEKIRKQVWEQRPVRPSAAPRGGA